MGMPTDADARRFLRAAHSRFEDASVLLNAGRTTGAVYLAGYGVECALKALILEQTPRGGRERRLQSFRTVRGHDLRWLKAIYHREGGTPLPHAAAQAFAVVTDWRTDLRYWTATLDAKEAVGFLSKAKALMIWAEGRI